LIELHESDADQFAFFSAYFIFSIPSAKVIDTIGYKKTMVAAW